MDHPPLPTAEAPPEGPALTGHITEMSVEAVVIRADGRREPLGTIAYWHENPLRRLVWRLTHKRSNPHKELDHG